MNTKPTIYLSAYYHDADHPCGIVLLEFHEENFNSYNLLKELHEEFVNKNFKIVSSYYYDLEQKDPSFPQKLFDEILKACSENIVLAKDHGWNDFTIRKYMGWVIVELSYDKNDFYNDGFWEIS